MAIDVMHFYECSSPGGEGQGLKSSLSIYEVGDLGGS